MEQNEDKKKIKVNRYDVIGYVLVIVGVVLCFWQAVVGVVLIFIGGGFVYCHKRRSKKAVKGEDKQPK